MKSFTKYMRGVFFVFALLIFVSKTSIAQDPVKVAPNHYKVLLENDRVRVLEITYKPGEKAAMHSHPASVNYYLSDFKAKFTFPDGKTANIEGKKGVAEWHDAFTHAAENIDTTVIHLIAVELKEPVKKLQKETKK